MAIMKTNFLVAIFAAVAVLSRSAYGDNCANDDYACDNLLMARLCNAVTRCALGRWKDIVLKQDPSTQCETCNTLVSSARKYMGNEFIRMEMKSMLLNACPMIQDANLSSQCKDYVNNYFEEIVMLIASEADPKVVCATINVCHGLNVTATDTPKVVPHTRVARSTEHVKADTKCILCEFILKEVDSLVSDNATEQEILAALEKVCSILPSTLRSECVNFIDTYGPTVFFLLSHDLDPQVVCTLIGLCSSQSQKTVATSPFGQTSEACGMCENIVTYLDSFLVLNSTIGEIDQLLEKVCAAMPGDLAEQCRDFVEMYGGAVVYMIAEQLDPKAVCTMLGLCSGEMRLPSNVKQQQPSAGAIQWKSYPCNQGPSHWCRNSKTATQCKAIGYCKTRVWLKI